MASMGLNMEEQKAVERFRTDVVEPSQTKLVILDFWAEGWGPCKALAPLLEKVAADYADKGVVLVKINVDEAQMLAGQLRIQSIPTVYAFWQGQPIDGFQGAVPGSEISAFIDRIIDQRFHPVDSAFCDERAHLRTVRERITDPRF